MTGPLIFLSSHLTMLKVLIHDWRDWDVNEDNGVDYEEMKPILEEKANINVFQEKFKLLMSQLDENEDGMVDRVGKLSKIMLQMKERRTYMYVYIQCMHTFNLWAINYGTIFDDDIENLIQNSIIISLLFSKVSLVHMENLLLILDLEKIRRIFTWNSNRTE